VSGTKHGSSIGRPRSSAVVRSVTLWVPDDGPLLSAEVPPKVLRLPRTPEERFVANFVRRQEWNGDCLEWTGSVSNTGYGVYRARGAHVVAYELWFEPVPPGKVVMHSCDNPLCLAPRHLTVGTHAQNMADKCNKGRARGGVRSGQVGELNNSARVSAGQAQFALDLYAAGYRQVDIARFANLTSSNTSNIVHRRTWKHLSPNAGAIGEPPFIPRRERRRARRTGHRR
jgi:hypothetical protein